MRKYTLARSVAIFSILVFLMMLTLGQLALSDTGEDIPDDGGVARCGLEIIDKTFGNMSARYSSRLLVKADGSQMCNETVYVCRLNQHRSSTPFLGLMSSSSMDVDFCTHLTSLDFEDVSREKVKAVFVRLASNESELASGAEDSIQRRVVGLAVQNKFTEAHALLKSYLYNQIWLGDGT